jgi:hypothetical protein
MSGVIPTPLNLTLPEPIACKQVLNYIRCLFQKQKKQHYIFPRVTTKVAESAPKMPSAKTRSAKSVNAPPITTTVQHLPHLGYLGRLSFNKPTEKLRIRGPGVPGRNPRAR